MTTIQSNEGGANAHKAAFSTASEAMESAAWTRFETGGSRSAGVSALAGALRRGDATARMLSTSFRQRGADLKAVHAKLDETDRAEAQGLASV